MSQKKKKKHPKAPRRKRMDRAQRLQSARQWLARPHGKNLIREYARWFGVDLICAVRELRQLGVSISAEREAQLAHTLAERGRQRRQRREALEERGDQSLFICPDEPHGIYFVVGYTEGGFPYGLTREQFEKGPDELEPATDLASEPMEQEWEWEEEEYDWLIMDPCPGDDIPF